VPRALAFVLLLGASSCAVYIGPEPRPVRASRAPTSAPVRYVPAIGHVHRRAIPHAPAPAPVPRAPGTAPPAPDASVAQLCVDEINRYRATLGLGPLERASDREACANGQVAADASSGHWHGRFGACGDAAQNECNASPTPAADMIKGCLHGMWSEGPGGGHYENMKSASATKVWCGFYTTPNGDVWSVQDFR
jgi:hypothetical protein